MHRQIGDARSVSVALFNNAAFTEVLASAHGLLTAAGGKVTTRQVAAATGRSDSVVRPVMLRLVAAGLLVDAEPNATRGPHPFTRGNAALWRELLGVVSLITEAPIDLLDLAPSSTKPPPFSNET